MPYKDITELPDKVTNNLPKHGQEIYLKAFNNAWEEYQDVNKRRNKRQSLEQTAHRVAWNAVKQKYHKDSSGQWRENES